MAYLVTQRRMAFGTYTSPRQARRRPAAVRFEGHYGLGWLGLGELGAVDYSQFLNIVRNALVSTPMIATVIAVALRAVFGNTNPDPSQINAQNANAFILALGGGPGSVTAGNPIMRLTGAAGAARDALYRALVAFTANPPQLAPPAPTPAPAPPVGAPVGPAPIVAPAAPAAGGLPASAYAGTPVPVGFAATQIFVDGNGHQWMYNQAAGIFQDATAAAMSAATASEQAQAAQIAAATATSPGGPESPTLVTSPTVSPYLPAQGTTASGAPVSVSVTSGSSYSDILNWLGESTLVSFAPNWAILAGVGFLALKLSGKKGLL
jgi:hypothetical protein